MKSILILAVFLCFAATGHAEPPELTLLRQQYDRVLSEQVSAPYAAGTAELDRRFRAALESGIAEAKEAGRLDDVLALQGEQQRLVAGLQMPESDDASNPEALKKLRSIVRAETAKLDEVRRKNAAALLAPYGAKLHELEVTLTRADRIAEATAVRNYREGLATENAETPTGAPAASVPMPVPVKADEAAAAAPTQGVLKGLGQFMFGNHPVDLSHGEGITDFVEVKVSHMGWIARRASGEVRYQIQAYAANGPGTRGTVADKRAVAVNGSEGKPLFAVFDDGTAADFGGPYTEMGGRLPAEVAVNVAKIDAAHGLYVVLHRDGSCSFAGPRRDALVQGLELDDKGKLEEVADIACSRYQVFFLMRDGSVRASNDFRTAVPTWADLPGPFRREIRAISVGASGSHFYAVTTRGDALDRQGANPHRQGKDLVDIEVGGIATIAQDTFGHWEIVRPGDEAMAELLGKALAIPRVTSIDLHHHDNSGNGKDVSRAVLWIEAAP